MNGNSHIKFGLRQLLCALDRSIIESSLRDHHRISDRAQHVTERLSVPGELWSNVGSKAEWRWTYSLFHCNARQAGIEAGNRACGYLRHGRCGDATLGHVAHEAGDETLCRLDASPLSHPAGLHTRS